jgi:hypothetical protein
MKTNVLSRTKTVILSLLTALILLAAMALPASAASTPAVTYRTTNSVGVQTPFGFYEAGTRLTISTSNIPDLGQNIFGSLNFFCSIFPKLPPCAFVAAGNYFVRNTRNTTFRVWLYCAVTNRLIWTGDIAGGRDIVLGRDHPGGYRVYLASKNLADCFLFVGLVPH